MLTYNPYNVENDNGMDDKLYYRQIIHAMREALSQREFDVIHSVVLCGEKKSVLAREYEVTPTTIAHLEKRAKRKLFTALSFLFHDNEERFNSDVIKGFKHHPNHTWNRLYSELSKLY